MSCNFSLISQNKTIFRSKINSVSEYGNFNVPYKEKLIQVNVKNNLQQQVVSLQFSSSLLLKTSQQLVNFNTTKAGLPVQYQVQFGTISTQTNQTTQSTQTSNSVTFNITSTIVYNPPRASTTTNSLQGTISIKSNIYSRYQILSSYISNRFSKVTVYQVGSVQSLLIGKTYSKMITIDVTVSENLQLSSLSQQSSGQQSQSNLSSFILRAKLGEYVTIFELPQYSVIKIQNVYPLPYGLQFDQYRVYGRILFNSEYELLVYLSNGQIIDIIVKPEYPFLNVYK